MKQALFQLSYVTTHCFNSLHQPTFATFCNLDNDPPPILVDYRRNERTIKGLIDVARDGYLWFLEHTDKPIRFLHIITSKK